MNTLIFPLVVTLLAVSPVITLGQQRTSSPGGTAASKNSNAGGSAEQADVANVLVKTENDAGRAEVGNAVTKPTVGPVLTEIYRVGVGDVLDIRFLNTSTSKSTLFTVLDGGLIDMPVAGGPVPVGGLTIEEIQGRLITELKRRAVGDANQISIGIRQYASHSVVVTGLVVNPGTKFLRRELVPLYVIMAESQLRNDAGRISILRAGLTAYSLDLNDPTSLNVTVTSGDVISVSGKTQEFYYVGGRITYPGQKIFQPGITLVQAILAAGGAVGSHDYVIEISREGADHRLVTTRYKVKEIKLGRAEDPKLQSGDRVEVIH